MWQLQQDLSIGALAGEPGEMFGIIGNVIQNPSGGLWVFDAQALELRLFDAEGDLVRSVGGEGDGPGEFRGNTCAFAAPEAQVWVESRGLWHQFSAAGDFLGTRRVARSTACAPIVWTPDGRQVASMFRFDAETSTFEVSYVAYGPDASGEFVAVDTFPRPDLPTANRLTYDDPEGITHMFVDMPLTQPGFSMLGPRGDLWVGEGTGEYVLHRMTLDGDTILSFGREYDPVAAPDSLRSRLISELRHSTFGMPADFDPSAVPSVFPPFEALHVAPDGTAWVVRRVEGGHGFDVFDAGGQYLGPVDMPFDYTLVSNLTVGTDHMVATVRDELGVQRAVRFMISRSVQ